MWPALAILAASAFLKYRNDQNAVQRQESIRRSMEAYQRQRAGETEAATNALVAKQTPQARQDEAQAITADRTKSLQDTVGAAQAFNAPKSAGVDTPAYTSTEAANADRISNRTKRAIEQLAVTGTPSEVQRKFGIRFGRAAGTVDAENRAGAYVGDAYKTDIANVRPNPLVAALAGGGQAAGQAMLFSGMGTKSPGAQPNLMNANAADWGSLDDGPGAYDTRRARLNRGFSLWGTS